jgi:GH43 family beta-xylosidase
MTLVTGPAYSGYFADPFVLRLPDGRYAAYGTGRPPAPREDGAPAAPVGPRAFEALESADLVTWEARGLVLERLPESAGDEYWAPEVAYADGAYWLYYSVGHGISGHHVRVARSEEPFGPFVDCGVSLTPEERFAIDAHPFQDDDGRWYLFYARDILDAARPGTHLAVVELQDMTTPAGPATPVLEPHDDWQLYQSGRSMYGATYEWHTIEGPAVVRRQGRCWMTYSGGAWTGDGYGVTWAVADSPLGPWHHPADAVPLLDTAGTGLLGPGHNSLVVAPDGSDVVAFHAWDTPDGTRQMYLRRVDFTPDGPVLGEPLRA